MMSAFSVVLIMAVVTFQAGQCISPGGSVYTRWGHKNCPKTAILVYSGYVGGSHYGHRGGAVEPLCLPKDPEWGRNNGRMDNSRGFVYGAEYEVNRNIINAHIHNQDVPCAVCMTENEKSVIVIPARKSCYDGWRREYWGYLMTGYYNHAAASSYTCVDAHPQALHGGNEETSTKQGLDNVEARCGSLKCPPYKNGWELTCVVCSEH